MFVLTLQTGGIKGEVKAHRNPDSSLPALLSASRFFYSPEVFPRRKQLELSWVRVGSVTPLDEYLTAPPPPVPHHQDVYSITSQRENLC